MERSTNLVVGVVVTAAIVALAIIGGTYAKGAASFFSDCLSAKPLRDGKVPMTTECICLYSRAVANHVSDEIELMGALLADNQTVLQSLRRKNGSDWIPMSIVKLQYTMSQCGLK